MASPPRSPSPVRSSIEPRTSVEEAGMELSLQEVNKDNVQRESSESSEDEEDEERKRQARMASPPRSPSPATCPRSATVPADVSDSDRCVDAESQETDLKSFGENNSEENYDVTDKQIRLASPPRSPSPNRSSEVESTNSTVREVMLETSDERDKLSGGESSEPESSDGEDVRESVARLSSPPRSPSPVRSPENGHTASELAPQDQETDGFDQDAPEDAKVVTQVVTLSPPRSPSPHRETNIPSDEVNIEDKNECNSDDESSEDEKEKDRTSRISSPPRSPSPITSREVEQKEKSESDIDQQQLNVDAQAESSSDDGTDEDEAVIDTVKMSTPPGSPDQEIDSLETNLKLHLSEQGSTVADESEIDSSAPKVDSLPSEKINGSQGGQEVAVGRQRVDADTESSENESETEEEAAERRRRNLLASPPASPQAHSESPVPGLEEIQQSVELLNIHGAQDGDQLVLEGVEVIDDGTLVVEEHTVEVLENDGMNIKEIEIENQTEEEQETTTFCRRRYSYSGT